MILPELDLIVIAHQEHFVEWEEASQQRSNFIREVFPLIVEAAR